MLPFSVDIESVGHFINQSCLNDGRGPSLLPKYPNLSDKLTAVINGEWLPPDLPMEKSLPHWLHGITDDSIFSFLEY